MLNFDNFDVPKITTLLVNKFCFHLDSSIKVHRNWTLRNKGSDLVMFTLPEYFPLTEYMCLENIQISQLPKI